MSLFTKKSKKILKLPLAGSEIGFDREQTQLYFYEKTKKYKREVRKMQQDNLRKNVRIAKANNEDINYRDFAEYINISLNSFYNWLNGSYKLSYKKAKLLEDITIDLIE